MFSTSGAWKIRSRKLSGGVRVSKGACFSLRVRQLPSPRAFIFLCRERAACEDSHRRQCRRNRLLRSLPRALLIRSLPALTSVRILTGKRSLARQ